MGRKIHRRTLAEGTVVLLKGAVLARCAGRAARRRFHAAVSALPRGSFGDWPMGLLCPSQVLTLASNERIPLNRTMRLVFEISHLRTATPATVSRAGILYINPADLGWNP